MKERAVITPGLIRQVQLMLAGGATGKEVAEITGTSEGTISRIKRAGFDYEQFKKNTEARRKKMEEAFDEMNRQFPEMAPQPEQLELQGGVDYQVKVIEELPGQIGMDLQPEKPVSDQVKMMRLIASQADKIVNQGKQNEEALKRIWTKLEEQLQMEARILDMMFRNNDALCQIMRLIGPEGGKRG